MFPTSVPLLLVPILPSAPALQTPPFEEPPVIRGEVSDWSRVGTYPKAIGSQEALAALAEQWGIKEVPTVDFKRYVLVVAISLGPDLKLDTVVDGAGDLSFVPREAIPAGYRIGAVKFGIKAVDRTAVKTAFGKPLPAE